MVQPETKTSRDWLWAGLLLAATFLAYRPAWSGQPIWDDEVYMTSPGHGSIEGLGQIWSRPDRTPQYYPLVHSVLWVEGHLWGQSTLGYHLLNIALHGACALLLVRILRRLRIPGAWLAGGIFSLHPVMVESVAWIAELKNVLSGILFLGAGLAYLRFDEHREKKHYTIALGSFLLGLLAKSAIIPFPAAMLVVLWWMRGRIGWKRDVVPLLPFFAVGMASGVLTAWVERRFMGAQGAAFSLTLVDRCLIAGRAVWFYLYKLLWPADLILVYPRWHIDATKAWQYLLPAALLFATALFWKLRARSRAPLAVLLYFTLMLFPVLGFFNINYFRHSFVADHFQYLAAMGPIAAAAAVIARGAGLLKGGLQRHAQVLLSGGLLSAMFLLSSRQSGLYSNAETLYRATIKGNDRCWMAHHNLGVALRGRGRTDEAWAQFQQALRIDSNRAETHCNLGDLLDDAGKPDEALAHYLKALELDPNQASTHNNLGVFLKSRGRTDEALAHYLKAAELDPDFADVQYNLGNLLQDMGRNDEALSHFRKASVLVPQQAGVHYSIGLLLSKMGRIDAAKVHYEKALAIDPNHVDARNNLGILLVSTGRLDEGIAHFRTALASSPRAVRVLKNLGVALGQSGQRFEASAVLGNALEVARSAGDEAQTQQIAGLLNKLQRSADAATGNSRVQGP
jgi:tetratricopeptide (TPR) repeat protein